MIHMVRCPMRASHWAAFVVREHLDPMRGEDEVIACVGSLAKGARVSSPALDIARLR
jgi:hypothetical protein